MIQVYKYIVQNGFACFPTLLFNRFPMLVVLRDLEARTDTLTSGQTRSVRII